MKLKLGKQCKWEDIKIGEVFSMDVFNCKTYFDIFYKLNHKKAFLLDTDFSFHWNGHIYRRDFFGKQEIYKLPITNQRWWKEE